MKKNIDWRENYNAGQILGKGKFGEVYEAITKDSSEKRAIKVLDKQKVRKAFSNKYSQEPTEEDLKPYIECFKNEVRNMELALGKNKDNENAVKLYEYYDNEKEFAIVMECCDTNLLKYINNIKDEEKFNILSKLNKTIKIMVDAEQVFIDLRLENILIKFTNKEKNEYIVKLKLTDDMGLMKQFQNIEMKNEFIENMHVDSPEILNKDDYNNKSDLWSLGIIIYFLYFKEYPYKGNSSAEILSEIRKGQSNLKKSGNSDLDDLIRGLLKEEAENRINWNQYFTHQFFVKKKDGSENFRDFYEIMETIGKTDNAIIYKARVKENAELRAIKVYDINIVKKTIFRDCLIHPIDEEIELYEDSFLNEYKHMKIVEGENNENNNTVKVYECYENENEVAIVMELCDSNLLNIFYKMDCFSSDKIGDILSQLNNSFKIMKNKKLIHLALNLENILVKYENEDKTKFSIKLKLTNDSCLLEDISSKMQLYRRRELHFIAPEIIKKETEKINEKCDLWSLGELIYSLAFHNYLFDEDKDEKLKQIKNINNHLQKKTDNPQLDDLIRKLLVEDPEKRLTWDQYFKHPFIRQKENVRNYYEVEKTNIGKSRFALIYKAKHKESNELRAIKIYDINKIRTEFKRKKYRDATEEDLKPYINGFNNEIRNMNILMGKNNNYTVKYYEHFHTNDEFAIVMELCDGNLLDFYIEKKNSFSPQKIKEILNLLNYSFIIMNRNNIIHRALNLENILIKYINTEKTRYIVKLKITDDSLVKDLPEIRINGKINSNKLFISPEILKKELNIEKCDLWSLGVIIYSLSCKDYPFHGKNESEILKDIQANCENLQIKTENSDLNDLIKKLLVENPDIRMTWEQYFEHPFFGKVSENFDDLYEIIGAPIGETKFAYVYKGKDKKNGESRAIKKFDKNKIIKYLYNIYLRDPTEKEIQPYINSFFNEAKHMKLIQGKNNDNDYTVKFYKHFNNNDEFIIIMELCDDTLLNYFVKKGKFSSDEIYILLIQLNVSFKELEENKLVHRALNLENILIKYDDNNNKKSFIYKLKLTNDSSLIKGLPKIHSSDEISPFLNYVAPEILSDKDFDEKSDLWSLGVIIYILLFQENPFDGETEEDLLEQINNNENNLKETNDKNLNDLIKKLLVKDPKNRLTWNEYFKHPFFHNEPFFK